MVIKEIPQSERAVLQRKIDGLERQVRDLSRGIAPDSHILSPVAATGNPGFGAAGGSGGGAAMTEAERVELEETVQRLEALVILGSTTDAGEAAATSEDGTLPSESAEVSDRSPDPLPLPPLGDTERGTPNTEGTGWLPSLLLLFQWLVAWVVGWVVGWWVDFKKITHSFAAAPTTVCRRDRRWTGRGRGGGAASRT